MGRGSRRGLAAAWLSVMMVVTAAAPAVAEVTLSPASGAPGEQVVARGTAGGGGGPCRTVEIRFGATQHSDGHVVAAGGRVADGRCDGSGRYAVRFVVPQDAPAGPTQVLVVARDRAGTTVSEESAAFTAIGTPVCLLPGGGIPSVAVPGLCLVGD